MAQTNTAAILFGDSLQLAGGVAGASTDQVNTIAFASAPSAGEVTIDFWGIPITLNTATGLPTASAFQTQLNAALAPTYVNPFTVALATNTYTITASATGPFAKMPLPNFREVANTSGVVATYAIATPGVTSEVYATVKGVEVMPWPGATKDIETYLTLDPGTKGYKRKVAKFADSGDVQFTVLMTNDAQQNNITGFRAMFNTQQTYDWRINEPTKIVGNNITIPGSMYYFSAYLSRFQRDGNTPDARQRWVGTLAIDGSVDEYPPAA